MSRFAFEIPTEQEAREFLEWRRREKMFQDDLYRDTLTCQRRLRNVTTPEERRAAREYAEDRRWNE